jgi:hypothetical protein
MLAAAPASAAFADESGSARRKKLAGLSKSVPHQQNSGSEPSAGLFVLPAAEYGPVEVRLVNLTEERAATASNASSDSGSAGLRPMMSGKWTMSVCADTVYFLGGDTGVCLKALPRAAISLIDVEDAGGIWEDVQGWIALRVYTVLLWAALLSLGGLFSWCLWVWGMGWLSPLGLLVLPAMPFAFPFVQHCCPPMRREGRSYVQVVDRQNLVTITAGASTVSFKVDEASWSSMHGFLHAPQGRIASRRPAWAPEMV